MSQTHSRNTRFLPILFATALLSGAALTGWLANRFSMHSSVEAAPPSSDPASSGGILPRRSGNEQRSVTQVLARVGPAVRRRYEPLCRQAKIAYPPERVALLAFKEEDRLEVWGADNGGAYRFLAEHPVLAASGKTGPKRREGDRQVPEGFYRISALNPNSLFHLSLRVDYPNATDKANATVPQNQMGGDIYVHGDRRSIGCLAMGDPAIEEIFGLVAEAKERRILIAPRDLRLHKAPAADADWVSDLYRSLAATLRSQFRRQQTR